MSPSTTCICTTLPAPLPKPLLLPQYPDLRITRYLDVQVNQEDRRVKYHYITALGLKMHQEAIQHILPDAQTIFSNWDTEEIELLHRLLFRLKNWLDDHRDVF